MFDFALSNVAGAPGGSVTLLITVKGAGRNIYQRVNFDLESDARLLRPADTSGVSSGGEHLILKHFGFDLNPTKDTAIRIARLITTAEIDSARISVVNLRWSTECGGILSQRSSESILQGVSTKGGRHVIDNRQPIISVFPNPSSGETRFEYLPSEEGFASTEVFDVMGRIVATPLSGEVPLGRHDYLFDTRTWSSGTYFYPLHTPSATIAGKIVVLR